MSCPLGSIQSFPVATTITVTADTYNSVLQPLSFEFQWNTRTTPPNFLSSNDGRIDENESSSVRYNGLTFNLVSVQLTDPTHKTWIIPSDSRIHNSEDIILTFSHGNLGTGLSEYLVFVIPILRVPQASDPNYLISFGVAGATQNISLQSLIPSSSSSTFAYYSTCSSGVGLNTPPTEILNVVSVDGLQVTDITMARIKTIFTNFSTNTTYGGYVLPIGLQYSSMTPFTISSPVLFSQYVGATHNILVPPTAGPGPIAPPVVDTTDAYKCVPFDPEKQVLDGKIIINPHDGTLLNQVISQRDALKQDSITASSKLTPDIYTKYVSTALACFFTAIIIIVVIYVCITATVGTSAVGHGGGYFHRTYKSLTNVPTYLIIGILCGFIGFMIGMVLKYRR